MPNPIGRKRIPTQSDEVATLKKELADLKAKYTTDMNNISKDMKTLQDAQSGG